MTVWYPDYSLACEGFPLILRLWKISLRNFRLHWRYLVSAGLSVLFGLWGLLLFRLYADDLTGLLQSVWQQRYMLGDVVIFNNAPQIPGKKNDMIDAAGQKWLDGWISQHDSAVAHRVRVLEGRGTVQSGPVTTIFLAKSYDKAAAAELRGARWKWDAVAGLPLHLGKTSRDLVIGQRLARLLGCTYESVESELSSSGFVARERPYNCPAHEVNLQGMTVAGRLNTAQGKIIGLVDGFFREIDARFIVMPIELAQRLFNTDQISYLVLKLRDPGNSALVVESIQNALAEGGLDLKAVEWKDFRDADIYRRAVTVTGIFETFILCIMGAVAGLCVVYSFRKNTEERAKEIGTLRSLGFRRRYVITIFGMEALVLTLFCSAVAVALTLVTAHLINALEIMYQVGGLNRPVQFTIGNSLWTYVKLSAAFAVLAPLTACLAAAVVIFRPITTNLVAK